MDKIPDKYNPSPLDLIRDPTLATRDTFVPWVFDTEYHKKKAILLNDLVPDRIKDPVTGKKYIPLYHGTVVDYKDVFRKGAAHIDFARAGKVERSIGAVLGSGFYLADSINAAKSYACGSFSKPGVSRKAIVVVVGIEENPAAGTEIRGDFQAKSNDLGESRDPKLFFNYFRGEFAFFTNTRPYMKILKIIELPSDFGMSDTVFSDVFGLASTDNWAAEAPKCLRK